MVAAASSDLNTGLDRINEQSYPVIIQTGFQTAKVLAETEAADDVGGTVAIPLLHVNRVCFLTYEICEVLNQGVDIRPDKGFLSRKSLVTGGEDTLNKCVHGQSCFLPGWMSVGGFRWG